MHKIYIIKCEDENTKRKSDKKLAVIPFTEYHKRILDFFGKDSKEYLIASLYNELTARDDFGCMRILRIIPYDNGTDNILFIDHRKKTVILLLIITKHIIYTVKSFVDYLLNYVLLLYRILNVIV